MTFPVRRTSRVLETTRYGAKLLRTRTDAGSTRRESIETSAVAVTVSPNCGSRGDTVFWTATGRPASPTGVSRGGRSAATANTAASATAASTATTAETRTRGLTAASCARGAGRASGRTRRGSLPARRWRATPGRGGARRSPGADTRGAVRSRPGGRRLSLRVRRTGRSSHRPGRASGTATPEMSGNDCSQRGSCTITGTTSQPSAAAVRQAARGGCSMKSERTNTNEPTGRSRRAAARCRRPCERLSAGAVYAIRGSSRSRMATALALSRGGSQRGERGSARSR